VKIAEIYAGGTFALSFEIYPPKTPEGMDKLYRVVGDLRRFDPGFVSCTYGAGGSTRDQTLDIVTGIRDRLHVTTTAHFTCVGSTVEEIRAWLREATARKVENIMALRGDPPKGEESFKAVEGGLRYANELVALIRSEFPHFGIGVAGYPETHQEAPSEYMYLHNHKRMVGAGPDAVFTQLFYRNEDFFRFRDRCRAGGIRVPIIPGLLPILKLEQIRRIASLCKAVLPDRLVENLSACNGDPKAQMRVGVEHATRQCEGLLREGVDGIHFYVLNRSEPTSRILDNVAALLPKSAA
jgi:methylenetetrahydrofolate reductase (NADPH)